MLSEGFQFDGASIPKSRTFHCRRFTNWWTSTRLRIQIQNTFRIPTKKKTMGEPTQKRADEIPEILTLLLMVFIQ